MRELFDLIFYQPLFNALIWLYNTVALQDLGIAIFMLTVIIRAILWPLSHKAIEAQKMMQELQPKLDAIKKQHKDNKQAQTQAIMELYKQEKVNPFGSCVPMLIQLPVFLALYWVLGAGLKSEHLDLLYPFVTNPGTINPIAFGFLDLAQRSIVIALAAGAAQYWQASQLITAQPAVSSDGTQDESMAVAMNKQMKYTMPIITVVIGASLPAGLSFYWFLSTVLYALQQYLLFKKKNPEKTPS